MTDREMRKTISYLERKIEKLENRLLKLEISCCDEGEKVVKGPWVAPPNIPPYPNTPYPVLPPQIWYTTMLVDAEEKQVLEESKGGWSAGTRTSSDSTH